MSAFLRGDRARPLRSRSVWVVSLLACAAVGAGAWLSIGLGACAADAVEPFQCGVRQEGPSGVVQECGGEHEICVCANNSCAREIDKGECQSGYQYLEPPFASRRAIAASEPFGADGLEVPSLRCVPVGLLSGKKIAHTDKIRTCTDIEDAGTDAGGTGGTGGMTASGGTGGTGAATASGGTGGVTSTGGTGGMTASGGTGGVTSTGGTGGTTQGTGGTP